MTTTTLDRVVHWALDTDGDTYGDERERLRWYEGIATAATLQWITVPWAAVVLVWVLGRPAVVPLAVVLVLMYVPMTLCVAYMRRRRVDPTPRNVRPRTVVATLLGGLPYGLFIFSAVAAYRAPNGDNSIATGAAVGAIIGTLIGLVAVYRKSRRRTQTEAEPIGDED